MESWSVENVKASKICLRIYRPRTLKAKYIHMHDAMINITCCQVFALQFVNYIDALNLLCGICQVYTERFAYKHYASCAVLPL